MFLGGHWKVLAQRRLVVPYEWFERETLYPTKIKGESTSKSSDKRPQYALVIWLARSLFSDQPLTRLAQVIDRLSLPKHRNIKVKIDVIGPSRSTTLRGMVKEIEDSDKPSKESQNGGKRKGTRKGAATSAVENTDEGCDSAGCDSKLCHLKEKLQGISIYSPWSTASPALLAGNWSGEDPNQNPPLGLYDVIPHRFKKIGVKFVRVIGSDDLLVMELISELKRRGVDVIPEPNGGGDCVALISEWDTFYGKAFPLTFATMMESCEKKGPKGREWEPNWIRYVKNLNNKMPRDSNQFFPGNLHTYSYIRGVDGRLPESEAPKENGPNKETESRSKWTYSKSLELPIGRGQLDYVRRLAQKLKDEHKDPNELKAIGVVGSDVYDKLVLLHALREQFSDVTFFATDLDARMMHHEQFKWTRNLIVASNYGLELNDYYQRSIYQREEGTLPPFRDNYQTALFFACRTVLGLRTRRHNVLFRKMCHEQLTDVIKHPRLFEIGRSRAVDISIDNTDIHPPRQDPLTDRLSRTLVLAFAAIAFCILLIGQSVPGVRKTIALAIPKAKTLKKMVKNLKKTFKAETWKATGPKVVSTLNKILKPKTWDWSRWHWSRWHRPHCDWSRIWVRAALLAVFVFVAVVIHDHYRPGGEPFSLSAGISIWPGEALRLLAAILSICLIIKSVNDLQANEERLSEELGIEPLDKFKHQPPLCYKEWREAENLSGRSKHALNLYTWLRYRIEWISIAGWRLDKKSVKAQQLWTAYQVRAAPINRFLRLIPTSVPYILLAVTLMLIFGPPNSPYRGGVSLIVHSLMLLVSVGSMVLLMFFVVDATRLCLQAGDTIISYHNWGGKLANRFKKGSALRNEDVENWLDVQFIAHLTEGVGKLIYYLFAVLLLMVVARSQYFDNWDLPIPLVVVLLGAGLILRRI